MIFSSVVMVSAYRVDASSSSDALSFWCRYYAGYRE
jgi:hypothetical protein